MMMGWKLVSMILYEEMNLSEEPQAGEGGDVDVDEPTSPSAGMMKWIDDDFFI